MSSSDIPSAQVLAGLVSKVTETMFGMSFLLDSDSTKDRPPYETSVPWRTIVLPINGARQLTVAIASDEPGAMELASAMFGCKQDAVDDGMLTDALSEIANIVAGQVKSLMNVDQALGLPKMFQHKNSGIDPTVWKCAMLKSQGKQVKVWVAVAEAKV